MASSMGNRNPTNAKKAGNDEFHTRLEDIENELRHYVKHFKNKTVPCNCDDAFEGNFLRYFAPNFNHLGLRKLIATSYCGSPVAGGGYQPPLFGDDVGKENAAPRRAYKRLFICRHMS